MFDPVPGMPYPSARELRLASFYALSAAAYLRRVRNAAAALGFPRRHWRHALMEWLEEFEGAMFDETGARLCTLPDIDALFAFDVDGKWAGAFARPCKPFERPRLQRRVWRRVQIIEAYLRDRHPHLLSGVDA